MIFCPMGGVQPAALYRSWNLAVMLTTARDVRYREQIGRRLPGVKCPLKADIPVCPLLGVKRTWLRPRGMSAFDPKRTSVFCNSPDSTTATKKLPARCYPDRKKPTSCPRCDTEFSQKSVSLQIEGDNPLRLRPWPQHLPCVGAFFWCEREFDS
jgi:hypothetical protein